jgi:hypothetical protein
MGNCSRHMGRDLRGKEGSTAFPWGSNGVFNEGQWIFHLP